MHDATSPRISTLVRTMLEDGADDCAIVCAVEAAEKNLLKKGIAVTSRGTRLPSDWHPSADLTRYAADQGLSPSRITLEIEKFKNYWTARAGAGAVKRDWAATWRNWILTAMETASLR